MPSGEALGQQAGSSTDRLENPGLTSQRVGTGKGVEDALKSGGTECSLNLPREETEPQKFKSFCDPQGQNAVSLGTGAQ